MAVIPARYASERFPGKVLAELDGKPLVYRVWERTKRARLISEIVVATDDERVREALEPLGATVELTRADHTSGTDRVAEVAARHDADIIVNVQGDEPLIDPQLVDAVIRPILNDRNVDVSTARRRLTDPEAIADPNVVKVVCDMRGRALYFSRAPIPHVRGGQPTGQLEAYWQHIGIYVYRREFLLEFPELPKTPLEALEKLEQLRAMENGRAIAVIDTEYQSVGVDTPGDLERVRAICAAAT
jgi:3-deoxy-manno-octulosonate cytidylyltransferase (CMP-KDO synthetase)